MIFLAVFPVSRRSHVVAPKVVVFVTRMDEDVIPYFVTDVRT